MIIKVIPICDNLSYVIHDGEQAVVVDPSKGELIGNFLNENGLTLVAILNTHHHYDHTGGNQYLKNAFGAKIFSANDSRITLRDRILNGGDDLNLNFMKIKVIASPGHTSCSLSFLCKDSDDQKAVFTGDTLFVGGCGRVEHDDYDKMWDSIHKLSCLPDDTLVYGGHEYALDNYEFAMKMFPDMSVFQIRYEELKRIISENGYSVPSTIAQEKMSNIFMQASNQQIKDALNMANATDVEVFKYLRQRKNIFG